MSPPRTLRKAVVDGVVCWAGFLLFTALLGFLVHDWTVPALADLSADWVATDGAMLLVVVVTSFLVVGAPVAFYGRAGLVTPLVVVVLAFVWFSWTVGVRAPAGFDAVPVVVVLYSWLVAPVVLLAALLEHGARRMYRRSVSPASL
ncbi:hypothetical protein ACFPYI_14230 [Halomarina salina]|uniref:Uncharacterized protein n=1 Tax=Halomarina salina TaxID=1872699 RepID=A0ABD5RQ71_9EURY|nr:hypothetical protein [Halomarina salina]